MTWLQRYRIRDYFRNSIWIAPLLAIVLAIVVLRVLHDAEVAMGCYADLNVEAMRTVLVTFAGPMFSLFVFVCTSLLLFCNWPAATDRTATGVNRPSFGTGSGTTTCNTPGRRPT